MNIGVILALSIFVLFLFPMFFSDAMAWNQTKKITPSDTAADDSFGISVAISGDTIVVGKYKENISTGSAYIFERNQGGADNWGQVKKLVASDASFGDDFGFTVGIANDTVVIGARGNDDAGNTSGSAYIFERNQGGADNWGQVKKLTASDATSNDLFGAAVAISGDVVVVGAQWESVFNGTAYIFERNQGGADNWGEVKKIIPSDVAPSDEFGNAVAVSGDVVVVGSVKDNSRTGAAYIFERNQGGADNWGEVKKLTASDAATGDRFGESVSVDVDTIAVGAYGDDSFLGSAYIFERNQGGSDNWGEVKELLSADRDSGDQFGISISVDGDAVVIGAWGDDGVEAGSGTAYVFERNQGGSDNWGEVTEIVSSDGQSSDVFGVSVSVSGNTAVVGAWGDDDNGSNSGSAYIFESSSGCSPSAGDWIITTSCTMSSSAVAPANVRVQNNSVLTIPAGVTLDIDFVNFNLTVESGSGVLIKAGGTIN